MFLISGKKYNINVTNTKKCGIYINKYIVFNIFTNVKTQTVNNNIIKILKIIVNIIFLEFEGGNIYVENMVDL